MLYKAVAFTTNEFYRLQSMRLEASLTKFGIPYEFRRLEHPGSWHSAVSMKPEFIRDMLKETTHDGVLYLDADAEVVAPLPMAQVEGCDIAFTKFKRSSGHEEEFLTGTMFLRRSEDMLTFMDAWIDRVPVWKASATPEQHALRHALIDYPAMRVAALGPEWTYIHDDFKELFPDVKPLILHYQASREYREREAISERAKARQANG